MPILKQAADELTGVKAAAAAAQGLNKPPVSQEVLEGARASSTAKLDAILGLQKLGAKKELEEPATEAAPPTKLEPGVYQDDSGSYFMVREDGIQPLDGTPLAESATVFQGAKAIEAQRPRSYVSGTRFDTDRRFDEVDKNDLPRSLQQAEYLASIGYTNRQIYDQTGMFVGRDGKIRSPLTGKVLPDVFLQVMRSPEDIRGKVDMTWEIFKNARDNKIQLKLHDMIDWPELYKAYPQLAHVKVAQVPMGSIWDTAAAYDSDINTIYLKPYTSDRDGLTTSIVHEIQHAIQHIEGFSTGSSPKAELGPIDRTLLDGNAERISKVASEADKFLRGANDKMVSDLADFGEKWNALPLRERDYAGFYKSGIGMGELLPAIRKYLDNLESKGTLTEEEASNVPIFKAALDRLDEHNSDPRVKFANEVIALRDKMGEVSVGKYKTVSGEQEAFETAPLIGKTPAEVRQEIGENLLDKVTFGPRIEAAKKDGISEQRADEPRKTGIIQRALKSHVETRDPAISSGIRSSLSELRDIIKSSDPGVIGQLDQAAVFSGVTPDKFKKSLNNLYNWYSYAVGDNSGANPRELITDYELDWWVHRIDRKDPGLAVIADQLSYIRNGLEDSYGLKYYDMDIPLAMAGRYVNRPYTGPLAESIKKFYGSDDILVFPLARSKRVEDTISDALDSQAQTIDDIISAYPDLMDSVETFVKTPNGQAFKPIIDLLYDAKRIAADDIEESRKLESSTAISEIGVIDPHRPSTKTHSPTHMGEMREDAIRKYIDSFLPSQKIYRNLSSLNKYLMLSLTKVTPEKTATDSKAFNVVRDYLMDADPNWLGNANNIELIFSIVQANSIQRLQLLENINILRSDVYATVSNILSRSNIRRDGPTASEEFGLNSFSDVFGETERLSKRHAIAKYIFDKDETAVKDMFSKTNIPYPSGNYSKKDVIKQALSQNGHVVRKLREEILKSMTPDEVYSMAPWYPHVEKFNSSRINSPAWARARDQGWTTEVMFHTGPKGENEQGFSRFKDSLLGASTGARSAKMGHFTTNSPITSQGYSSLDDGLVYPVLLKYNNPAKLNYLGQTWRELGDGVLSGDIQKAFKAGHDAVIVELFDDTPGSSDIARHIIVKSGSQIRSAFDAFSPKAANSKRLDASKNFAPKELLGVSLAAFMAGAAASDADASENQKKLKRDSR